MGNTAAVTGSIRAPLGILVGAVGIEQNALTFLRDYKRAGQLRKTYEFSEWSARRISNSG